MGDFAFAGELMENLLEHINERLISTPAELQHSGIWKSINGPKIEKKTIPLNTLYESYLILFLIQPSFERRQLEFLKSVLKWGCLIHLHKNQVYSFHTALEKMSQEKRKVIYKVIPSADSSQYYENVFEFHQSRRDYLKIELHSMRHLLYSKADLEWFPRLIDAATSAKYEILWYFNNINKDIHGQPKFDRNDYDASITELMWLVKITSNNLNMFQAGIILFIKKSKNTCWILIQEDFKRFWRMQSE